MREQFVAAVEAIYDAAPDPSKWPAALTQIAKCFDDAGAILQWSKDDDTFGVIASEGLSAALTDYVEHGWSGKDLKAARGRERGYLFNGEPFTDRHVCDEDEIRNSAFATQFLAVHGLGYFGAVAVSPDPHVGVVVSVQRDFKTKPAYSDSELQLLGSLGRHVEKSLRLSIRLMDSELNNVGLGDALTRVGIAVFGLDSDARIVFSNSAAKKLVGGLVDVVDGRLCAHESAERNTLTDLVTRSLKGDADTLVADRKPILLHSKSLAQRLVIYLLPVGRSDSPAEHLLTRTRAIVLAIEQVPGEPPDPTVLRDLLGLTLGEARVAALIGSGLAPREAALKLGIAEETARSTLKKVFGKVSVSRQSELAVLISRMLLA